MASLLQKSAHWTRRLRRQAQRHMLTIKNRANVTIESTTMNARDPKRVVIDRFGSLLPFGLELEKGIFTIHATDSESVEALGYVLEIAPQTGATPELAHHLESIFSSELPSGTGIQVSLFASPTIDWATRAYSCSRTPSCVAQYPEQASVLEALALERTRYLQNGTCEALTSGSTFRMRHFRAWVSVVIPTSHLREDLFVQKEKVKTLRDRHIAALKTFHLYQHTWGRDDLLATLKVLTNSQKNFLKEQAEAPTHFSANPVDCIAHQVLARDTHIRISDAGLTFSAHQPKGNPLENAVTAIGMSVQGYPSDYALPLVKDWIGSDKEDIPCPFLITTAIAFPNYEKTKSHANLMAARSKQIASSEVAHYLPSLKKRAQDYEIVTEEYAKNGALIQLTHQVLLFAPQGVETQAVEAARSVFKSAHLEVSEDACMHLQSFLTSLPMTLTPSFATDIKIARRFSTKTLTNVCHMVPILGELRGTDARDGDESITPLLLLNGRHGQVTPIDIFANVGNFNAVIVGSSGSGKSALTNDLITGNLGTGGKTYVIDVGGSYKKLVHLLEGQWIEYTKEHYLVINPFELIRDIKEDMGFLIPILVEMASPNEGLSDFLLSVLQAHALHVLTKAKNTNVTPEITDLVRSLRRGIADPDAVIEGKVLTPDSRILDLATQLAPYSRHGIYGHYFCGKSTVNFTSNFMVLELEGLKSRKSLQSVILLCLIFVITQDLTQGDLSQRKMVVIDEAWDLLSHRHAASFIENGYRRARKQNAAFITITQSFEDYYKNETAKATLANADLRFILRQKAESIAFLEKEKKVVFSPWEMRAIKSLRMEENAYAECLFMSPTTPPATLQIRFDDFSRLLYSTKATDMARIEHAMKQGMTLTQAIFSLIHKH